MLNCKCRVGLPGTRICRGAVTVTNPNPQIWTELVPGTPRSGLKSSAQEGACMQWSNALPCDLGAVYNKQTTNKQINNQYCDSSLSRIFGAHRGCLYLELTNAGSVCSRPIGPTISVTCCSSRGTLAHAMSRWTVYLGWSRREKEVTYRLHWNVWPWMALL